MQSSQCKISLILFFLHQSHDGGQGFAEFQVVGFYAVVEVEFDALLGQREQGLALPLFALVEGLGKFVGFLAGVRLRFGGSSRRLLLREVGESVASFT